LVFFFFFFFLFFFFFFGTGAAAAGDFALFMRGGLTAGPEAPSLRSAILAICNGPRSSADLPLGAAGAAGQTSVAAGTHDAIRQLRYRRGTSGLLSHVAGTAAPVIGAGRCFPLPKGPMSVLACFSAVQGGQRPDGFVSVAPAQRNGADIARCLLPAFPDVEDQSARGASAQSGKTVSGDAEVAARDRRRRATWSRTA